MPITQFIIWNYAFKKISKFSPPRLSLIASVVFFCLAIQIIFKGSKNPLPSRFGLQVVLVSFNVLTLAGLLALSTFGVWRTILCLTQCYFHSQLLFLAFHFQTHSQIYEESIENKSVRTDPFQRLPKENGGWWQHGSLSTSRVNSGNDHNDVQWPTWSQKSQVPTM